MPAMQEAATIQTNLVTFASAVGNAVGAVRYIPARPAEGTYELTVNAQGSASWTAASGGETVDGVALVTAFEAALNS